MEQNDCVLSFRRGIQLARIEGGAYKNKIIYVLDKNEHAPEEIKYENIEVENNLSLHLDDVSNLFKNFVSKYEDKEDAMDKIVILIDYLKINKTPTEEDIIELFNNNKAILNGERGKYMNLKEGTFIPIPLKNDRYCIYIAGPSGCGKSTWGANYAIEYNEKFPDRMIILFSRKNKDPVFDDLPFVKRMVINAELCKDPIQYTELTNSLCIFDDIDTIPEKYMKTYLHDLVNDLLEIGRSSNISVIRMCHQINKGNETKTVINEAHLIVLFPRFTLRHWIDYLCTQYLGFDKKTIDKICKINSRSVVIFKNYPITIMHDKGIFMIQ